MPDYTLTQTAATVDASLVKSATYIPKAMVTVADITARNAIASGDKENGKVVRVLNDGSGNVAYYSWNSSGSTWANAYFPVDDGTITSAKLDTDLYDEIYTPTYETETTETATIIDLPSTALKSQLNVTLAGNTQTPYDQYTKLLMLFEGSDTSTTFTDQTGKTVTPSGDAQIDTAQYRYGSSSGLFDGNGDYLTVTDANNDLDIGTSDFCIEIWFRQAASALKQLIEFRQSADSDVAPGLWIGAGGQIRFETQGIARITGTTALAANTWHHVAVARSSGVTKLFVNGGQEGSNYTDANNYIAVSSICIASNRAHDMDFNGWIDCLRISVGTPRYTSNFTPLPHSTLSSDKMRILSVGKNLFDGVLEVGSYNSCGVEEANSQRVRNANQFIPIDTAYSYKFSKDGVAQSVYVYEYGATRNFVKENAASSSFTPQSNTRYINFKYIATTPDLSDKIQMERGSIVTTYVPFTSTSAIVPLELKKISSTIKDEFDCNTGLLTKNTEKDTDVSSTQYDSLDTATYTNVDVVKTTAFSSAVAGTTAIDAKTLVFNKDGKLLTEVAQADIDNLTSVGKYYYHTDKSLWFIIANGAYANIGDARTGLGTSQIYYQLSSPVVTEYWQNILTAEPSGTIYCHPFISDYDFYDGGCVVTNASYPISSLEYVNIVNKVDGSLTPVALSTCTVAVGGLSFTSTAISSEDLVDFGYTHIDRSTVPDVIYSYPTNLKATVDENTEDIALLDEKIERVIEQERIRVRTSTATIGSVSSTTTYGLFIAPVACEIADVKFVTATSISTNNSDYWTFEVIDKGSAGSDTNVICTKNTTITSGTAITAYDAYDLGAIDATHGKLSQGDVVLVKFTKSGSATTMTEGMVMLSYIAGT